MAAPPSRFLGSARIIAVCTLASRVTGLARDITLNHIFGQNWVQDAFNYGFLIPNLFRRLFGEGALSAVFVPVFTDVLTKRGRPAAWRLLGRVAGLMGLALTILLLLLELGTLTIGSLWSGGEMRSLQIGLTAVMAPFMFGVCVVALFSSILNCLNHFTVPALLPIVLNVMIIVGATLVGPWFGEELQRQVYGVGLCVIIAAMIQLAILLPVLRGHGVHFRLSLDRSDPDLRRIVRMFIPILLGQGLLLFNVFFDAQICTMLTRGPGEAATFSFLGRSIAYPLTHGALSAVNNAQRLYQFPLGVLAISLATAAFPTFSRYATHRDTAGLRSALAQSLRLAIYVGLPSGLMLILLGESIIALLFQHGRFGPEQTVRAAEVLRWYGLGMTAFCCQHILLRGFYSLKDTITPMKISCWLVGLNLLLNLALIWTVREPIFGISTSITATLHVCISVWLLRRRLGGTMGATAILASAGKTAVATIAASLATWAALRWAQGIELTSIGSVGNAALPVFVPLATAAGVYLLASRLLRMEEPGWLLSRRVDSAMSRSAPEQRRA
ncbi:MAG: murein biosynthesis integral membrane protein MurJ [Phycisphaerae bacterium]